MSVHKKIKTGAEMFNSNTRFECKCSYIWKIKGFLTKCTLPHIKLQSPKFTAPGFKSNFFMRLIPKGETSDDADVALFIYVVEGNPVIICEFALVDVSGRKFNKGSFSARITSEGFGFPDFISREELEKQKHVLLHDNELTVSCVVTISGYTELSSQSLVASTAGNTVVDDLASLFDSKAGADVLLKVDGHSIPAHKTVLMCRSSVFCAMFKSDMQEGNTGEVQVSDIDLDVLQALLSFLYSDRVSLSDVEFALKLLAAAVKYAVELLQNRCAKYLEENLSADNVFDILLVAEACCSKDLCQNCVRLIEREMSLTDIVTHLDVSPHLIKVMKEHLNPK